MFRELEEGLLKYKKTGNYPIQMKEIGYVFPFTVYTDDLRNQLSSENTPHTYEEMIKMEKEIMEDDLDEYVETELDEMTRSCIPIDEMIKFNLFEKLICKLDYRENAIRYLIDLVILANYKPELLTEKVIENNYWVDEYNESTEGFIPLILYYVVKNIIPEAYIHQQIPNINIISYTITDEDYPKFSHIDYAPIKPNESIVYTLINIQYDWKPKSIVKTDGEYYLLYENYDIHQLYRDHDMFGHHYVDEDKQILELIIKYADTEYGTIKEFEANDRYY